MSEPWWPYGSRHHADPVPESDALTVEHLRVEYPSSRTCALDDVTLRAARGARVALVGPNGAGKSTLLKAIAGLLPVRSGRIRIFGNRVGACHHRVAYLPQRGEIEWDFPITLERFVMTGRYVHLGWLARPRSRDWDVVSSTLAQLKLDGLEGRQIGQLSGGQQQRAMLARALTQGADLLLLDEPLNAVDAETRMIVTHLLAELCQRGKSVIAATHDLGRLDRDFDAIIYLSEGRQVTDPDRIPFAGTMPTDRNGSVHISTRNT